LATALVIAVAITALAPGAQGKTIADLPGMFAGAFFLSLVLTAIGFPVFMFVSNWIRGPRKPKSHLDRVPTDQRFAEHAEVRQALSEGWELYNVCPSKVIEEADPASSDPPSP
jgi:hypothetical protein